MDKHCVCRKEKTQIWWSETTHAAVPFFASRKSSHMELCLKRRTHGWRTWKWSANLSNGMLSVTALPTTMGCCEACVSNEDLSQLLRAANISISFMQKLLAISFMRFLLWYFFSGLFHVTATTPNGVWRRRFSSAMESHRRQECLQTPSTYITFLLPLLYGSFSNVFLFTFSC